MSNEKKLSPEAAHLIMGYLDIIEAELEYIAKKVGHCDFKTFVVNGYRNTPPKRQQH